MKHRKNLARLAMVGLFVGLLSMVAPNGASAVTCDDPNTVFMAHYPEAVGRGGVGTDDTCIGSPVQIEPSAGRAASCGDNDGTVDIFGIDTGIPQIEDPPGNCIPPDIP